MLQKPLQKITRRAYSSFIVRNKNAYEKQFKTKCTDTGHGALKDGMVYGIPVQGEGSDQWYASFSMCKKSH